MKNATVVWGIPLSPLTRVQAVDRVDALIRDRVPSFFITANVHYAMLTAEDKRLAAVNDRAAFILADGAPLVIQSRRMSSPVPERVAGSDLIYDLCERAALKGHRVCLLGGSSGIADLAAEKLRARYPGLQIVGTLCPSHEELFGGGAGSVVARIRDLAPDLLMVALGQPKGEFWIAEHLDRLGVPVCVQVGATLDFVAGRVKRAPRAVQKAGMEWAYRIYTDPKRLGPRYLKNGRFLLTMVARDILRLRRSKKPSSIVFSRSAREDSLASDPR